MIENQKNSARNGCQGPVWQEELFRRSRSNLAFQVPLQGATVWDRIPVGVLSSPTRRLSGVAASLLASSTLGYFTSSTTGAPKQIVYSARDWEECVAHRADVLAALGLGARHRVAVILPFGPWFSGDNISEALLRLGARVLSAEPYVPHLAGVAWLMAEVGVNALVTTPSIALALSRFPAPGGMDKLILVGESAVPAVRAQVVAHFQTNPVAIFATSEAILGPEVPGEAGTYSWDPARLHLEVRTKDGDVAESGTGELVVTRRYGIRTPLLRYPLGDLVELSPCACGGPRFKYLGRIGHGFSLATGVCIGRAQLDRFLDELAAPIHEAAFFVHHATGRDQVRIDLGGSRPLPDPTAVARRFAASSLDVADVVACGFLDVTVRVREAPAHGKRRLRIEETPWEL